MNPQLQPLRISSGWTVTYNVFHDVPATPESVRGELTYLTEDLLQLYHERDDRLIDLGWYPEGNFENGVFRLQVYEGDFRGIQVFDFRSKDKNVIVGEIERLCREISDGRR